MEPSRADFYHPYQPYDIQLQFMKDLYKTIEDGKIGIFESPTGTGKSLSLICGSLTWLRDYKRRALEGPAGDETGDDPDWMIEAERQQRRRIVRDRRAELEVRLSEARRREKEQKKKVASQRRFAKRAHNEVGATPNSVLEGEEVDFLPVEYDSDEVPQTKGDSTVAEKQDVLSSDTQALLAKLKSNTGPAEEAVPVIEETRIIFCSRTHSQLTQFVKELRRVKLPPSIVMLDSKGLEEAPFLEEEEVLKHLSLGSRKNLCINQGVSKLGSVTAVNEKCLDLQKASIPEKQKCPFLLKRDNQELVESFRDHALARIHDIEDLSDLGRSMGVCPYYASRAGIESSEILTLPYPLLLQKSAREALGVSVKNHVVIIDEAHNLMDAIADSCSCSISLHQLETATGQVMTYVQKFKNRLKGRNRMYVTQIIRLLNSISDCLRSTANSTRENEGIISPAQLLAGKGVDQIQPYGLIRYLKESKLAHKVENYVQSNRDAKSATATAKDRGGLQLFQNLLAVLMNPSTEGRFFFSREAENSVQIRYTLLDPREHFRDIVEDARAVILVGGTMSPMSDYQDYLFSYLPPGRLQTFSFGHVVPSSNIFAQSLSTGPTGVEFDFTFAKRTADKMIIELGLLFIRACQVIPDGVVAFFPSYDYLSQVVSVWKKTPLPPATTSVFSALNAIKPIFQESKATTTSPQQPLPPLLQSYTLAIDQQTSRKGGLLLTVTSGSLSEGINFSDRLARAVFAIGLPYPNPHSAVWKAKLGHIEELHQASTSSDPVSAAAATGKQAAREFYVNATLRAVNQAIGRAIRHRHDYAAILLVDRRWDADGDKRGQAGGQGGIKGKLPGWIREAMMDDNGGTAGSRRRSKDWSVVEKDLEAFFDGKV